MVGTYKDLNFLVYVDNLNNLRLELFDHLLLGFGSPLSCLGNGHNLFSLALVVVIKLGVMLRQLAERLA